jgi:hypothetical protein
MRHHPLSEPHAPPPPHSGPSRGHRSEPATATDQQACRRRRRRRRHHEHRRRVLIAPVLIGRARTHPPGSASSTTTRPGRGRGVSTFLDKNRRFRGKSQSKRPAKKDATAAAPSSAHRRHCAALRLHAGPPPPPPYTARQSARETAIGADAPAPPAHLSSEREQHRCAIGTGPV